MFFAACGMEAADARQQAGSADSLNPAVTSASHAFTIEAMTPRVRREYAHLRDSGALGYEAWRLNDEPPAGPAYVTIALEDDAEAGIADGYAYTALVPIRSDNGQPAPEFYVWREGGFAGWQHLAGPFAVPQISPSEQQLAQLPALGTATWISGAAAAGEDDAGNSECAAIQERLTTHRADLKVTAEWQAVEATEQFQAFMGTIQAYKAAGCPSPDVGTGQNGSGDVGQGSIGQGVGQGPQQGQGVGQGPDQGPGSVGQDDGLLHHCRALHAQIRSAYGTLQETSEWQTVAETEPFKILVKDYRDARQAGCLRHGA